jgi:hypothetical protein
MVMNKDESFDRNGSHMAGKYVSWTLCLACGKKVTNDSIHTCSPQLKELTDEEIDNVGDAVSNLIDTYAGRREFARAILRKAQEK